MSASAASIGLLGLCLAAVLMERLQSTTQCLLVHCKWHSLQCTRFCHLSLDSPWGGADHLRRPQRRVFGVSPGDSEEHACDAHMGECDSSSLRRSLHQRRPTKPAPQCNCTTTWGQTSAASAEITPDTAIAQTRAPRRRQLWLPH